MALHDFWSNVLIGARWLSPRAIVDSPKLDSASIEKTLRGLDLWLTPKCVEGFDEADFFFLPEPDRKNLANWVSRFREIASTVPPNAPATKKQVDEALPLFLKIIEALDFHRYGDAEAYVLGKQIENLIQLYRPTELADLRFKTGRDHTGDPGIWIWAILEDRSDPEFRQNSKAIHALLETASRKIAPERWPYVGVRAVSEQDEIVGVQAR